MRRHSQRVDAQRAARATVRGVGVPDGVPLGTEARN